MLIHHHRRVAAEAAAVGEAERDKAEREPRKPRARKVKDTAPEGE